MYVHSCLYPSAFVLCSHAATLDYASGVHSTLRRGATYRLLPAFKRSRGDARRRVCDTSRSINVCQVVLSNTNADDSYRGVKGCTPTASLCFPTAAELSAVWPSSQSHVARTAGETKLFYLGDSEDLKS